MMSASATALPIPKRRAMARIASSAPAPSARRIAGATATASMSWPPTKKMMPARWRKRTTVQVCIRSARHAAERVADHLGLAHRQRAHERLLEHAGVDGPHLAQQPPAVGGDPDLHPAPVALGDRALDEARRDHAVD